MMIWSGLNVIQLNRSNLLRHITVQESIIGGWGNTHSSWWEPEPEHSRLFKNKSTFWSFKLGLIVKQFSRINDQSFQSFRLSACGLVGDTESLPSDIDRSSSTFSNHRKVKLNYNLQRQRAKPTVLILHSRHASEMVTVVASSVRTRIG